MSRFLRTVLGKPDPPPPPPPEHAVVDTSPSDTGTTNVAQSSDSPLRNEDDASSGDRVEGAEKDVEKVLAAGEEGEEEEEPRPNDTGIELSEKLPPVESETADIDVVKANETENGEAVNSTEEVEDESKYPSGAKLLVLTFGLCMATFVVALDNTIIATAIPRITTQFDSLNDVGWYGSSYLLTTTSLQPSFGKIYTYFDVKWVYLSALLIFELGSIICATAVNSTMLIVGRAIAGCGAAALFSGGINIIAYSVALRKRALYLAVTASMFGIASVVGPILGGVLTDQATWRWCFWINLPFGAVALVTVFFFFTNPPRVFANMTTKDKVKQIDMLGAFFLICAIVCLLLALQWGGSVYPWSDSRVWGCLLGFGLLIIIFSGLQFYLQDLATMPPRILCGQRSVRACAIFNGFIACALYTHIYYLPFYFQAVKGVSAEQSGIRCIPYLVSITIASIVSGGLITALGSYTPFMWVGGAIFCVGTGMIFTLDVDSPIGMWIGYQVLSGFGCGLCIQIPFIAVQTVLKEVDIPVGSAIAIFFNTLGGAISVSVAQNIFTNTLIQKLPRLAPTVNPLVIINAGATHIRQVASAQQLPGVLQAYDKAVTTAFILPIAVSGLAFLASLSMEWKSVKGKKIMPPGA